MDDVWACADTGATSTASANANRRAYATRRAAIREEDTVASSVFELERGLKLYRGRLREGRGAATGAAMGFRIPALLGRERDEDFTEERRGRLIERRGDHRRRVGDRTKGAVVRFQAV